MRIPKEIVLPIKPTMDFQPGEIELIKLMRQTFPYEEINIVVDKSGKQWTILRNKRSRVVIKIEQKDDKLKKIM